MDYYVVLEGRGGLGDEAISVVINLVSDMDGRNTNISGYHFFSFYTGR